jgi:hypothetical protein
MISAYWNSLLIESNILFSNVITIIGTHCTCIYLWFNNVNNAVSSSDYSAEQKDN